MRRINIFEEVDRGGIPCVIISKVDYNYLYEMSELLMNISDDLMAIRGIVEGKAKVFQNRIKELKNSDDKT